MAILPKSTIPLCLDSRPSTHIEILAQKLHPAAPPSTRRFVLSLNTSLTGILFREDLVAKGLLPRRGTGTNPDRWRGFDCVGFGTASCNAN